MNRRAATALVVVVGALAGPAAAAAPTASIGAPATATAVAVRVAPPPPAHFATLPVGTALPSGAACAAQVRPAAEVRPTNAVANHTLGTRPNTAFPRVDGAFTGTTDEILQWVACKWGIDEDIVRAQIAKESWWHQDAQGDTTSNQALCDPPVRTGSGTCGESLGLGQVRYQYHGTAFVDDNARLSSAYNVDYTYAVWRSCFEGELTWLNTVERGSTYAAGDTWGCLGVWFSGRWHTAAADQYIAAVQDYLSTRIWTQPDFAAG